jgi:hypothetical protein
MATNPVATRNGSSLAEAQLTRVTTDGCASHAHRIALLAANGVEAARDLADAVHLLCAVHGRFPGLADLALNHCPAGSTRDWIRDTAEAFDRERLFLVRLTSAVGPLPSTPGAAACEASLVAQRHAIETLAKSERSGCTLGACAALVQDWRAIRAVLDKAAERSGIEIPAGSLPDDGSIAAAISAGVHNPGSERALAFGSEQMLLQHRGLFDLLEARAEARQHC